MSGIVIRQIDNTQNLNFDEIIAFAKRLFKNKISIEKIDDETKLTINGFSEEFENEVLKELEETKKLAAKGEIKKYNNVDVFFADLEK